MRTSDMIKSKFWRAGDVMGQPPKLLTIADVTEEVFSRGSKNEVKCYLWFSETLKGLQLNKTRVRLLEGAYGPDSDLWVGKRVRISYDPAVEFGGRAVGGVRLETPAGVVYRPSEAHNGWADAPVNGAARPPAPLWDEKRQIWVTPPQSAPSAAPASAPRPPPPVWNEATKAWETVDGATGEIKGAPGAEFDKALGVDSGGASAEFDDKIPF